MLLSFLLGLKCHDSMIRGLFGSTKMQLGRLDLWMGHRLYLMDLTGEDFPNTTQVTSCD